MKAKQLSVILSGLGDMEVMVCLSPDANNSTPCVPIKAANYGLYWGEGRVVLLPSKELVEKETEEYNAKDF